MIYICSKSTICYSGKVNAVWRYFLIGHSRRIEERLRNRLYQHLQCLSLAFYQRTKTGDIMARSTNDINAVRMATGMGIIALTDRAMRSPVFVR